MSKDKVELLSLLDTSQILFKVWSLIIKFSFHSYPCLYHIADQILDGIFISCWLGSSQNWNSMSCLLHAYIKYYVSVAWAYINGLHELLRLLWDAICLETMIGLLFGVTVSLWHVSPRRRLGKHYWFTWFKMQVEINLALQASVGSSS